jgi:serine/threonine-protein kinase
LVLPYRDGASLRQILDWIGRQPTVFSCGLPLWWVLGVLRQVAAALAAMHQAGWLHGQVQPEHILVHPTGYACLIDLTCARRLKTPECFAGVGGPNDWAYAAPEWSIREGFVTPAADIYALGCVLWECLTGRPPFTAATTSELIQQHRRAALPPLRSVRPDVAWDVAAVAHQMLAKEGLRRPTAEQVERWLAEMALEALHTACWQHPFRLPAVSTLAPTLTAATTQTPHDRRRQSASLLDLSRAPHGHDQRPGIPNTIPES